MAYRRNPVGRPHSELKDDLDARGHAQLAALDRGGGGGGEAVGLTIGISGKVAAPGAAVKLGS